MPRNRLLVGFVLIALGLSLSACESFDLDKLNPFGDNKKPLPGERKPVFPEGVPGVTQGVPPEYRRDQQPPPDAPPPAAEPAPPAGQRGQKGAAR